MFRISLVFALVLLTGGLLREIRWIPIRPPWGAVRESRRLTVTGYCRCGACCSWKRNFLGVPVVSAGSDRGRLKMIGYTADGSYARPGTIAADTSIFPFGTILHVPGYGYGRVEDRGEAIKGYRIDLFFRSHEQAESWGEQVLPVGVWAPSRGRP
jgi:3D (Asp-Asp-Asp) domain-containing protein